MLLSVFYSALSVACDISFTLNKFVEPSLYRLGCSVLPNFSFTKLTMCLLLPRDPHLFLQAPALRASSAIFGPSSSQTNDADVMVADGIVAYSADGSYEVTIQTKATVYYNGLVVWQPPAVYKSSCAIDVEFFPYDVQTCVLKLGSWTYDGFKVTIKNFLNGKTKIPTNYKEKHPPKHIRLFVR